jgi:hypothetical protein
LVQLRFNLIERLVIFRRRGEGLDIFRRRKRDLLDLEQFPLVELLGVALGVAVDLVLGDRAHFRRQVPLHEGAGEDLLARAQDIEMHGWFAVQFPRKRLLHQIFSFDHARQRRLDDRIGALVGGDAGKAKLVVKLLLSDVVRADMGNDLPDHGLRLLLFAASGKNRRRRERTPDRGDAPAAVRDWRDLQQNCSPEVTKGGMCLTRATAERGQLISTAGEREAAPGAAKPRLMRR